MIRKQAIRKILFLFLILSLFCAPFFGLIKFAYAWDDSWLQGLSGYVSNQNGMDDVIALLAAHPTALNVTRLSFTPSWYATQTHPWNSSLITYFLAHTPATTSILIDRNHLYPPGAASDLDARNHWSSVNSSLFEILALWPNNSRVMVELINEYCSADFDVRMQNLITNIRLQVFNNTLVANRMWPYSWTVWNDPINETFQGFHQYMNERPLATAISRMQTARDTGIQKIINTEIGANYNEHESFTDTQVRDLEEFFNWCYNQTAPIFNCLWMREDTENWDDAGGYDDRAFTFPVPPVNAPETIPPYLLSSSVSNTTEYCNVTFTAAWNSSVGLAYGWLYHNESGSWELIEQALTGTEDTFIGYVVLPVHNSYFYYYYGAADTDGNFTTTDLYVFTVLYAEVPPVVPPEPPETGVYSGYWVLSCGDLQLRINQSNGWIMSLTHDGFEVLGQPLYGLTSTQDRGFQQYDLNNGTYSTFAIVNDSDYSTTDSYARLTVYLKDWASISDYSFYNQSNLNVTYTLYSDRLEMQTDNWLNWSYPTANLTFYTRLGTNYADWDSIMVMGGPQAFGSYSQLCAADNTTMGYEYVAEKYAHAWLRPMALPYAAFIKNDLVMSLYSEDVFNHTQMTFWDDASYHQFRTDLGFNLDNYPIPFTAQRTFVFKFDELTPYESWMRIAQEYVEHARNELSVTPVSKDDSLYNLNAVDMWACNIANDTLWDIAANLSAKVVWLYGWQSNYEIYPTSGSWTMASGGSMNATYLKTRIAELQARGFKIFMYYRDNLDYNTTILTNPDWLFRTNATSTGYYWLWSLPNDHNTTRTNWWNISAQAYHESVVQSIYDFYEPDGIGLDCGTIGPTMPDHYSYGSGDVYMGLFNFTRYVANNLHIPIIYNGGGTPMNWFTVGSLFEDPSYNNYTSWEYLSLRLYDKPGWLLTTSHSPWDVTSDGEIFYTKIAMASGLGRCFNMEANPASEAITNETTRETIISLYSIFLGKMLEGYRPTNLALYPINDNFRFAGKFWAAYYNTSDSLWVVGYENGTGGTYDVPLYDYANETYTWSSLFDSSLVLGEEGFEGTFPLTTTSGFNDRLFTFVPSQFLLPLTFVFGMVGLASLFIGPLYGIHKIRHKEYRNGFIYAVIIFSIGFALFISWLWH